MSLTGKEECINDASSPLPPKVSSLKDPRAGFDLFKVWTQYETLAMHFNDLLMRLRSQSLAAVAAFATAAGVLIKTESVGVDFRWGFMSAVFSCLFVFWIAIWILDLWYYNRLLLGAVEALLVIERASLEGDRILGVNLSVQIEAAVRRRRKGSWKRCKGIWVFYFIVCLLLLTATGLSIRGFGGTETGQRVMRGTPFEKPTTKSP